jgi:aspartyl-tRNA(Asn)/glutamyl-tRNA(Gln) amidotransferase subunit C
MISKEEVKHIAKLAKIELKDEEVAKFQKDLSSILGYFEMLKKIDTKQVEPTFHPSKTKENILREDKSCIEESADEIAKAFPEKRDGYVKVKAVFK